MKFPSEREVLRCVAKMYESSIPASGGDVDPYLPMNVTAVAEQLGCKPATLFGYLFYHLDRKHHYEAAPHTYVHLFVDKVGERRHCVNYPYLVGILAAQDAEHTRSQWAISLSMAAFVLSLAAIVVQVATSGIAVSFRAGL